MRGLRSHPAVTGTLSLACAAARACLSLRLHRPPPASAPACTPRLPLADRQHSLVSRSRSLSRNRRTPTHLRVPGRPPIPRAAAISGFQWHPPWGGFWMVEQTTQSRTSHARPDPRSLARAGAATGTAISLSVKVRVGNKPNRDSMVAPTALLCHGTQAYHCQWHPAPHSPVLPRRPSPKQRAPHAALARSGSQAWVHPQSATGRGLNFRGPRRLGAA